MKCTVLRYDNFYMPQAGCTMFAGRLRMCSRTRLHIRQ